MAAGAAEAVLEGWAVDEDETFSIEDVLATIETDKAVVEVAAESDGVILRVLVHAGASTAVGAPIAVLGDPGESVADMESLLAELGVESETSSGAPRIGTSESDKALAPDALATDAEPTRGPTQSPDRLFISPLARRLAKEAGLDSSHVTGTGPKGRIRKRDVEAALASVASEQEQPQSTDAEASEASIPTATDATIPHSQIPHTETPHAVIPHTRMRRAIASRLTESKQTVPHFYVRGTAHVDALVALRADINAGSPATKVSFNDLLLKAVAVAHRRHPEMNVVWTDDAIHGFDHVDIAVAVASERGLVTPVLRSVDTMRVTEVACAVRSLAERANAGKLKQDELEGGTISLSNLGMFGVEEFTAVINPPHAAILSVGAIREEPVVRGGKIEVGHVLHLVASVDHRSADGAIAAAWMGTLLATIERPVQILA